MIQRRTFRGLLTGAAALALLATGALAIAPSTAPHALADDQPTPTTASSHRQPIVFPPADSLAVPPSLGGVEGVAEVAPGGLVKVDGLDLGDSAGSLCLHWSNIVVSNSFTQNGQLCLDVIDWQATRVIASVPSGVVGLPDQTAQVIATRSDGPQSNGVPIKFVATRETRTVVNSSSEGSPVFVQCSDAASNTNECHANPTSAYHENGLCCSTADEVGAVGEDRYFLDLHFGWSVESASVSVSDGQASISHQPGAGATGGYAGVFWSAGGFYGSATYTLTVTVVGPAGVPLN